MKSLSPQLFLALSIILLCFDAKPALTQDVMPGEWLGSIETYDGQRACRLRTRDDKTQLTIYNHIANHWLVAEVNQDENKISFKAMDGPSHMSIYGELNGNQNKFTGHAKMQNITYKIVLQRRISLSPKEFEPYLGFYQTADKQIFYIKENQQTLHLHSPISGEYVVLKSIGKDLFHTRSGEQYSFSKMVDGKNDLLQWRSREFVLTANRFDPYKIEEIVFFTNQDTIYGSLYLPKDKLNNPAVMLALGAGGYDRHAYSLEAELLAAEGIASLIVDFPGTGKSSGNRHDITFDEKRDMTVDIFRDLQKHPKIDASRCGIRGGSQSGRIALMAASKIPDIAAVISVNVPLKSQLETQLFAIGQFLRSNGVDEKSNSDVVHLWSKYFQQVAVGAIDTSLVLEIAAYRKMNGEVYLPTLPSTNLPRSPHASDLRSNTTEILSEITCPVLFQLAVLDERVPFTSTRQAITKAVANKPSLNFTIIEYPFANHGLMLPGYQITQGLFTDKIKWLKKHL